MELVTKKLTELNPYPNNPRINDDAVEAVAESIKQCEYVAPIIVDEDMVILAGHTRLKALESLGMTEAEVLIKSGLTDEQKRKYRILDNKTNELSEWDFDKLAEEIEGLDFGDLDIDFGIDLDPEPGETEEDDFVITVEEPNSKPGDLFRLGRHRLMCGDSTSPQDAKILMGGADASILFTSPPYSDLRDYGDGSDLSIGNLKKFIDTFEPYTNIQAVNLGIITRDREVVQYWDEYIAEAKECGYKLMAWNVWDKGTATSVGSYEQYFPLQHEWVFVFGKERRELNRTVNKRQENVIPKGQAFRGIRNADGTTKRTSAGDTSHRYKKMGSVLNCQAEHNNAADYAKHPARFPVALPGEYIKAMTDEGDNVIDCFGGSGTTLIACEQLNRTCYMMELEPRYIDIIINRWEQFTGEKAVKIDGMEE